jgi:hypothetical protein
MGGDVFLVSSRKNKTVFQMEIPVDISDSSIASEFEDIDQNLIES